ncbi:MAG: thiosulfate oxidation carrier complex protein SoxZ [Pseudomonadota bacterium]
MAKKSIRIRARQKDGITTVKALISHPMETGQRKNSKTGKLIPAHFIQEVTALSGETLLMKTHWGPGVSKNPYVAFKYRGGQPGEEIILNWVDNTGQTGTGSARIR